MQNSALWSRITVLENYIIQIAWGDVNGNASPTKTIYFPNGNDRIFMSMPNNKNFLLTAF